VANFGPYHLTQTDVAVASDRSFIDQQIKAWNNRVSPHHLHVRSHPPRPLDLFLRDETQAIVGGLVASTFWSWLDIDDLWLREDLRHRGFGSQLLLLAEQEALARECRRARVTTFSFQARGFYERFGYRVVGRLDDFPPGSAFFWLRKDFSLS
jgi:GNAT superfamily N-acetyltransferase